MPLSEAEYKEAAKKVLSYRRSPTDLDNVYPGDRYDDNATRAAGNRIEDQMNAPANTPIYPSVPEQPYAQRLASGGLSAPKVSDVSSYMSRRSIHKTVGAGMLKSPVPGRTDKLPIKVPSGSYVIPADIVSGLGQGNSDAGNQILSKMFTAGPGGMQPMKGGRGPVSGASSRIRAGKVPKGAKIAFAEGGAVQPVDVIAAGGEVILYPEQVMAAGGGDLQQGHEVLDAFVKHTRKQLIKTLKKLPGPVKD